MYQLFMFLEQVLNLFMVLLIIRIIMSWVSPGNMYRQPFRFLYAVTEPVMAPFRAIIPPIGGLDLSPMLLFMLIGFLQNTLRHLAVMSLRGM
jgi:YggT family protein